MCITRHSILLQHLRKQARNNPSIIISESYYFVNGVTYCIYFLIINQQRTLKLIFKTKTKCLKVEASPRATG